MNVKKLLQNVLAVVVFVSLFALVLLTKIGFTHLDSSFNSRLKQIETVERVEMKNELAEIRNNLLYDIMYNESISHGKQDITEWFKQTEKFNPAYNTLMVYHMDDDSIIWDSTELSQCLQDCGFMSVNGELISFKEAMWSLSEYPKDRMYAVCDNMKYLVEWIYAPNNKYDFEGELYTKNIGSATNGVFMINLRSIDDVYRAAENLKISADVIKVCILLFDFVMIMGTFLFFSYQLTKKKSQ